MKLRAGMRRKGLTLLRAWRDFLRHRNIPGYCTLPLVTRCRLNLQALILFLRSGSCWQLLSRLCIWLLGAQLLVWQFDLRGPVATLPPLLASLWVLPWVASKRRRYIARLLQNRWPD